MRGGRSRPFLCSLAAFPLARSSAVAPATRPLLALLARGCVLRPLDELFRHDQAAVLVFRHELKADPATVLVHLLDEHVEHIASCDHVLDVSNSAGPNVRDVE